MPKSKTFKDSIQCAQENLRYIIDGFNLVNNLPEELKLSVKSYIWYVAKFSMLQGMVSAFNEIGLKQEMIKEKLAVHIINNGLGKYSNWELKEILRVLIKKEEGSGDQSNKIQDFRLILEAHEEAVRKLWKLSSDDKDYDPDYHINIGL